MSFSVNYLVFCVPTLHINNYRNRDIVLNTLIAEFITLCVKHHMAGKVPKSKDFYKVSLCSNTIVSTWLDTSILMSEPPDVRGNKSSRFHLKISKFSSSASSPLVRGNISTISGNPREMGLFQESGKPIVSTLICSARAWDFIASTLIPSMTEFVIFPASTWPRIITTYLFRPGCSFLNHKWYFAIIHK